MITVYVHTNETVELQEPSGSAVFDDPITA